MLNARYGAKAITVYGSQSVSGEMRANYPYTTSLYTLKVCFVWVSVRSIVHGHGFRAVLV